MHTQTRRLIGLSATVIAGVAIAIGVWVIRSRLGHASIVTGWMMLVSIGLLMLLGIRKRFPMLPLVPVRYWTQFHIYFGLLALVIYALHVPALIGSGVFESTLSFLFLAVSLSGLYGVWISRRGPKRLNAVDGEYRFDQFGWHRRKLADRAASILQESGQTADLPVLAQFYAQRLQRYFTQRPGWAYVLVPTSHRRRRLLSDLGELDRYFSANVKQSAGRLAALIRSRDDLDFHYATQLRMRLWLAIHLAMTFAMLVFIVVHVLMVLRFRGG